MINQRKTLNSIKIENVECAEQSWDFATFARYVLYKMQNGKKNVMKDVQVLRITENLRLQDLMSIRQSFCNVLCARNDHVHSCAAGNQVSQIIYLSNAGWSLVYSELSFQLYLLDVFSSSKSEEFKVKDIEVLVDSKDQPWFKQAHIGKFLGLVCMRKLTEKPAHKDQKS